MEIYKIAIRAAFSFVFLLALVRLSGKRVVSEGTAFDFVLAVVLGDLIDDALWAEVPISQFVVATGTLAVAELVTAMGAFSFSAVDRLVEGSPALFMRDGRLVPEAMRRELMNESDVAHMLRSHGLEREEWEQVERAWVEERGEPSVIFHEWAKPARKVDVE